MEPYTYFAEIIRASDEGKAIFNLDLGFGQWKVANLNYSMGFLPRWHSPIKPRERYIVKVSRQKDNSYIVYLIKKIGMVQG